MYIEVGEERTNSEFTDLSREAIQSDAEVQAAIRAAEGAFVDRPGWVVGLDDAGQGKADKETHRDHFVSCQPAFPPSNQSAKWRLARSTLERPSVCAGLMLYPGRCLPPENVMRSLCFTERGCVSPHRSHIACAQGRAKTPRQEYRDTLWLQSPMDRH
jgi:hypothetical protein